MGLREWRETTDREIAVVSSVLFLRGQTSAL